MTLDERLRHYLDKEVKKGEEVYIAKSAELIGDITLGDRVSVLPKVVIRADINRVFIGSGTNLQDGVIIHLSDDYGVIVGENCTVGHGAILHACTIDESCLIGMRATVMDGALIGKESIIGAHSLVTANTVIPEGSLVLGSPARVVRSLSDDERKNISYWARKYEKIAKSLAKNGI